MTQKEAVLKVLRDANKPMKCAEISNVAVRDGLLTKRTKAVNFESSVRSYIVELLSEGLVKQVDKGLYEINNNVGLNETETNNIYELNMTTKSTDNTIKYYGRNIILMEHQAQASLILQSKL